MRCLCLLLLCAACAPRNRPPEPEPEPETPPTNLLPAGFSVRGSGTVEMPSLPPDATWRFLVSQLHDLRAEARAQEADLLVTFEAGAVHVTNRAGRRRTWQLPPGLRLEGGPRHVVLGADLTATVYAADGTQVGPEEEITVVSARIGAAGGNVEEFRLVIKGARTFRSISTAG